MNDAAEIAKIALLILIILFPVAVLCWFTTLLLMKPLDRAERGELLLDVIQTGMDKGLTPERAILSASEMRENALGPGFYLLAELIREDVPLVVAMRQSKVLPSPAREILITALEDGGLASGMIAAARASLQREVEASRRMLQGPALMFTVLLPLMVAINFMLMVFVIPKLRQIAVDMEVDPALIAPLFEDRLRITSWALIFAPLCLWLIPIVKRSVLSRQPAKPGGFGAMVDALAFAVPWRRMRMCEDFSRTLALLLDAGLPEQRALSLAGGCSGNRSFVKLVERAGASLSAGQPLTEAVRVIESSPEFRWRLDQGRWGAGAFQAALRGWVESLVSRAALREEWAAQAGSTAVLLINGTLVALLVSSVFAFISAIISEAATW